MPPFGAFHDIAKGRAAVLFLKANDVDHPDKLPILFFVQAESFVLRIGAGAIAPFLSLLHEGSRSNNG